jgi:hypothetical protein
MIEIAVAVVSVVIAAGGFGVALMQWRETGRRKAEVHSWVDKSLDCLCELRLVTDENRKFLSDEQNIERINSLYIDTSTLVEKGRIFFCNEIKDSFGSEKLKAYRGYRPDILDQLMVAHQIAFDWPKASPDDRRVMALVADFVQRKFLTLAISEVGRSKPASKYAGRGGDGAGLRYLVGLAKKHGRLETLLDKEGNLPR